LERSQVNSSHSTAMVQVDFHPMLVVAE